MCIRDSFITGPSLPYVVAASAMAKSPDGRGVLLFGGYNGTDAWDCTVNELICYDNRILELHSGSNSWNIFNITLKNRRMAHTVITLPWIILISIINLIIAYSYIDQNVAKLNHYVAVW